MLHLQYSLSHSKLDMLSLVETEAKKAIVYHTPGISRSFLIQSKKPGEEGLMRLKTEGINIQVRQAHPGQNQWTVFRRNPSRSWITSMSA